MKTRMNRETACLIEGQAVRVVITYQKRKTLVFFIRGQNLLEVRCPLRLTEKELLRTLQENEVRIGKKLRAYKEPPPPPPAPELSAEAFREWIAAAEGLVMDIVTNCVEETGLSPSYVRLKELKSIWGSCTGKRGVNLNSRLIYCPREVIRYVVLHELCHLRQPNHSKAFWQEVAKYDVHFKLHRKWLSDHGRQVLSMPLGLDFSH